MGKFIKSWVTALIATAVTSLNVYLAQKYGISPHLAVPLVATPVLFGLQLIFKHWHLDALATDVAPDDPSSPAPGSGASTVAKLLVVAFLIGLVAGCKTIDAKTLAEFQGDDAKFMKDLGAYLDSDQAAGKKTAAQVTTEKTTIAAHTAKVQADVTSVDPTEEQTLIAEVLGYVQADPAKSAGFKSAYGGAVQGHLDLFNSVHR